MTDWQGYLEEHAAESVRSLADFVRIPSVSALPDHAQDVLAAAEWAADRLRQIGLEHVALLPTGGHPVVYADWVHAPGKPTVLLYGHVDVQPVDPEALWTDPPFAATIHAGRLFGRGASDNKGNLLLALVAIEALIATEGRLPVNLKCFIEGQEEIGSPQLPAFVQAERQRLACDLVVSTDASQWSEEQPALEVATRGLCDVALDLVGPARDLHSGVYGGVVQNPIHALVQLLDTLRSPDGTILVAGFFDRVRPLTDDDRARCAATPFDETAYRAAIGVEALVGEPSYSAIERLWMRPTLEINGIGGGFQGEGTKTVIPSTAHAKISCRLVPDQDPDEIVALIVAHLQRHTPEGVRLVTHSGDAHAWPYHIPVDHPGNVAAAAVLAELYGRPPLVACSGATVPVCELFLRELGAHTLNFGFGLDDERCHAPDEFFRLASFARGQQAYGLLLHRLGEVSAASRPRSAAQQPPSSRHGLL